MPITGWIDFDYTANFIDTNSIPATVINNEWRIAEADLERFDLESTEQTRVEGSYRFDGPTQFVQGTFSVNTTWSRLLGQHHFLAINTADYQNDVQFSRGAIGISANQRSDLFTANVDGAEIIARMDSMLLLFPSTYTLAVPEPSTYALAAGCLLCAFAGIRYSLMKRFQSFAAIMIALLFTNSTSAQIYIAESTRDDIEEDIWNPYGYIELKGGSFKGNHYAQKVNAEIELNAEDRTVIFRRVTFEIPLEGSLASGFGESVFIEGKIKVEFISSQAFQLISGGGTHFLISETEWNIPFPNSEVNVTYEFSGPTENVEGTVLLGAINSWWERRYPPNIGTRNYPNDVAVGNRPQWSMLLNSSTISENIDGANISFFINSESTTLRLPDFITFVPETEPSKITGIRRSANAAMVISGMGTIGISDSAAGPFSGSIALPAIIQPESSTKFFKAN